MMCENIKFQETYNLLLQPITHTPLWSLSDGHICLHCDSCKYVKSCCTKSWNDYISVGKI